MRTRGFLRSQLERRLRSAYTLGLMTHDTFAHRIGDLYGGALVDPQQLVGDLTFRRRARSVRGTLTDLLRPARHDPHAEQLPVLALDWTGATPQLMIGRSTGCELVLQQDTVSRRHAQLYFREGRWIVVDLGSTNGTFLNEQLVRRTELLPGDIVRFGAVRLRVD